MDGVEDAPVHSREHPGAAGVGAVVVVPRGAHDQVVETVDAVIRELRSRGFGPVSGGLLALWGLSAACAVSVVAMGWY